MNVYRKIFIVSLTLFLLVSGLYAQRKKSIIKKQPVTSSRKVSDSRLTAPANRKFNHRFDIDYSYDKFENKTKVQLRLPINSVESVHFAYFFSGAKIKQTPQEIIFLYFKDSGREFLFPVKDFVLLTDKDRLRIKMVESLGLESDGKIPYLAKLDYSTFLRIANAEKVDMKIGNFEITFDEESLEALKDLASKTNPNLKKDAETIADEAAEKQFNNEVDKLVRTNSDVKNAIREILEPLRQALLISDSSAEQQTKQSVIAEASRTYIKVKDIIPNGTFKEMLDSAMKDLVRADILRGVSAGIIDKKSFDTSEIIRHYKLSNVPEADRPNVILSNARETIIQLYTLASTAKIID